MNRELEAGPGKHRRLRTFGAGLLALALSTGLLGCGPGVECDSCDNDKDCKSGLTCEEFSNGDTLCADTDTETCTKTTY